MSVVDGSVVCGCMSGQVGILKLCPNLQEWSLCTAVGIVGTYDLSIHLLFCTINHGI